MAFLDVIERRTFFRLTRIVAFLWLLLLTASTVLSLVLFIESTGHSPGHVAPDSALPPSNMSIAAEPTGGESLNQSSNASPLSSLRIPLAVQSYLDSEENKKVIEGWLNSLDSSDRQDFIDNMAEVITTAQKERVDVFASINRYKDLKLAKIAAAKQGIDVLGVPVSPFKVVIGIIIQLGIIAIVSLILVLLAIERNTRKSESAHA
jgi:hypothetical protein